MVPRGQFLSFFFRYSVITFVLVVGSTACDSPDAVSLEPAHISPVRIIAVDALSPPLIGLEPVYTPDTVVSLELASGESLEVAAFALDVSVAEPELVKVGISGSPSRRPLSPMSQPIGVSTLEESVESLNDSARAALAAGGGVYWIDQDGSSVATLRTRVVVAVPLHRFASRAILEVYASTTSGGAPVGGDRIELAREFFYLNALGDSAMWGNGLREQDKFSYRVGRAIEDALGVRVIRTVYAVSGAPITPYEGLDGVCTRNCSGEAPQYYTSVTLQAESMVLPEISDLILMDGCGNDIGLETVLNGEDNSDEIRQLASESCYEAMAEVLLRVRALAPDAPIVVTGYFPFVSLYSDLSEIGTWAQANDIDIGTIDELAPSLLAFVANSEAFQEATGEELARAVSESDMAFPSDPPMVFVDPGFPAERATFATDSWLWGLSNDIDIARRLGFDLDLFPEDPILRDRLDLCQEPNLAPSLVGCIYGSVAHPNPAGAKAYTNAILEKLREIGFLPAGDATP